MEQGLGRPARETAAAYEAEAILAELTELVETQASELDRLRGEVAALRQERDELATELVLARGWVKELAARVEEAELRVAEQPSTLRSRIAAAGR